MDFKKINPNTLKGIIIIPTGYDLVIAEKNDVENTALVLYGFDEIGLLESDFKNPIYGFLKL